MTNFETEQTAIYVIALIRYANVSPRMMEALLRHFGNVERIIKSDAGTLMAISGMTADDANKIAQSSDCLEDAEVYYKTLKERDILIQTRFDKDYPEHLFELNDPPSLIYYRGSLPDKNKKSVALVGNRKASNEGIELTTTIVKKFAEENVQIISGLIGGIDIAAHLGTKAAGGKSFALLESGLEHIYPEENRPLAIDIVNEGGLITEYRPEIEVEHDNYKATNRLIAAIAQAVIITEYYENDEIVNDLLQCCSQIGKMTFIMIDSKMGGLIDEKSLNNAVTCGAIPMVGLDKINDIIVSLV